MPPSLPATCSEHGRYADRLDRIETDIRRLFAKLDQQNATILATLDEMRRETAERFEAWADRVRAAALAAAKEIADLQRAVDRVSATADLRRSVIGSAAAVCIVVAGAVITFLLRGCACCGPLAGTSACGS